MSIGDSAGGWRVRRVAQGYHAAEVRLQAIRVQARLKYSIDEAEVLNDSRAR